MSFLRRNLSLMPRFCSMVKGCYKMNKIPRRGLATTVSDDPITKIVLKELSNMEIMKQDNISGLKPPSMLNLPKADSVPIEVVAEPVKIEEISKKEIKAEESNLGIVETLELEFKKGIDEYDN